MLLRIKRLRKNKINTKNDILIFSLLIFFSENMILLFNTTLGCTNLYISIRKALIRIYILKSFIPEVVDKTEPPIKVKIIKYKRKLREIEENKKKYGWLISLKKFYNMGFFLHLIIIFVLYVMIVGWSTISSNIGVSDSILELIIIWPLFIIILADIICIIGKIFKRSFNID